MPRTPHGPPPYPAALFRAVSRVALRVVAEDKAAYQRRMAFNTMLDPKELEDTQLDDYEIAAISSFLAANVDAFSPLHIASQTLQQLLAHSTITVSYGTGEELPPYQKGEASSWCTVVLQGRLHVVCGSEGFESDRGPWTVLGAPCLRRPSYIADFTARVMEPSRLLRIHKEAYEDALKQESEALAAAVRAEAAAHARGRGGAGGGGFSGGLSSFGGALGGALQRVIHGGDWGGAGGVGSCYLGELGERPVSPVARVACSVAGGATDFIGLHSPGPSSGNSSLRASGNRLGGSGGRLSRESGLSGYAPLSRDDPSSGTHGAGGSPRLRTPGGAAAASRRASGECLGFGGSEMHASGGGGSGGRDEHSASRGVVLVGRPDSEQDTRRAIRRTLSREADADKDMAI